LHQSVYRATVKRVETYWPLAGHMARWCHQAITPLLPHVAGNQSVISISFQQRVVDVDTVVGALLPETLAPGDNQPRLIHLDVAHEVSVININYRFMLALIIYIYFM
jgi:hypothetical protein